VFVLCWACLYIYQTHSATVRNRHNRHSNAPSSSPSSHSLLSSLHINKHIIPHAFFPPPSKNNAAHTHTHTKTQEASPHTPSTHNGIQHTGKNHKLELHQR
jgi:hypothetical protein